MIMKILFYCHYVLYEKIRHFNFMVFQMKQGDLLIQSNKIIGFLKNIDTVRRILIFYRAVSIISTDRDRFDL